MVSSGLSCEASTNIRSKAGNENYGVAAMVRVVVLI